jgi:hypothetical protein
MKNFLWFVLGIAGGFVAAHLLNKDPRGHELLAEVDARIGEFADRIGDAYREQEARFSGIVDAAKDAAADAANAARDVAEGAADAAEDLISDAKVAAADIAEAAGNAVEDAGAAAKKAADKLTD